MWMKKRYILRNGDDQFTATVAKGGDGEVAVQLDGGDLREVDAVWVQNGRALSLRLDGRMHLVDLTGNDRRDGLEATINGRTLDLRVMDELRALAQQSLEATGGGGQVAAEIPGVVVALNVKEGQKVHQGESVLVLEAMKMQNEISAPVSGTVEDIRIAVGQSVSSGDLMLTIAPEAGG